MIRCTFEGGNEAHLRHAVVDALIVEDKKILLVKRADHLHGGGKWAIPGGFVDRDETVAEAVMREVLEETGYTSDVQELFTVLDKPDRAGDDRQNISFVFVVNVIDQVKQTDGESSAVQWFPLDALPAPEDMAFDHLNIIWDYLVSLDK
ncbi:MAG: hypothetical protein ACD_41C00177G0013 [uncultured bacterium]|nr:MAG: hypothetical protein ACD_41C00177G0013 [uncultured bacterium]HBY73293.1 ADP-ribose pyrophosphatase [Candidatus Kerfeldbacteria bacterium]